MKTITLAVTDWPGHRAGQHVDVRLTAPDGYRTERSYSIASGPEDDGLSLTVERLDDGEVSPYLVDELRALCSARSLELLIYREELMEMAADDLVTVSITLTRAAPSGWQGYRGRIDPMLLSTAGWAAGRDPLTYICGPTAFVETAAAGLVSVGYAAERIRTERFGGTGG
ncbi:FAD-binding oxidoreductase [Kribbella sp. NPDC051936]|uniref:FAD-binding oxidoreductase n=1 Tax=Kribbella sp. NPDC051936 TaxID=3154946 RepID=UPI00341AB807